jgi:hypothetical protein
MLPDTPRFPNPKRLLHWLSTLLLCFLWASCGGGEKDVPLDEISLDLQVIRLDEALYQAMSDVQKDSTVTAEALYKARFQEGHDFIVDWMFRGDDSIATDSLIGGVMKEFVSDEHGIALLDTLHKVLGGVDLKAELTNLFKRYKHYFPQKATPIVVAFVDGFPPTAQSGLDQINISPRFLGIGMHYFMGPSFRFYPEDLPKYIRRRCTPEHIPAQVAHKMADMIVPKPDLGKNPVLIDYVIHEGIKMYFVDQLLGPESNDTLKLYYAATQLDWATLYEGRVYKDLVTDLYSADAELQRRYIEDSPFTSQLNRQSAPRLGQYIGWKIVKEYMKKHPDQTLDGLVQMADYQKIFKDSGYRPPKEE